MNIFKNELLEKDRFQLKSIIAFWLNSSMALL